MFDISLWVTIACLYFIHIPIAFSAHCWSTNACIDVGVCAVKGRISRAGFCPGGNNIQCCSW